MMKSGEEEDGKEESIESRAKFHKSNCPEQGCEALDAENAEKSRLDLEAIAAGVNDKVSTAGATVSSGFDVSDRSSSRGPRIVEQLQRTNSSTARQNHNHNPHPKSPNLLLLQDPKTPSTNHIPRY